MKYLPFWDCVFYHISKISLILRSKANLRILPNIVLLACVLWCSWYRYHFFICIYSCFCNWISILFKILYFLTFRSILGIQSHCYDLYGFVVLYGLIFYIYLFLINTGLKVVVFGVILVHIFPHSDWIRKNFNYKQYSGIINTIPHPKLLSHFQPIFLFYTPGNIRKPKVFRGYRGGTVAKNGLKISLFCQ